MAESGCSICMDSGDTSPDRGVVITGCCKNLFHLDCIIQLYLANKDYTCPLCRGKMDVVTPEPVTNYVIDSEEEEASSISEEEELETAPVTNYVIDSEDDEAPSSSEEEELESAPVTNYVIDSEEEAEEGEGVNPASITASISIDNSQVFIYCRVDSGKIYVKDKLSDKPITELEIRHDLPIVYNIKCITYWPGIVSHSAHNIIIYDKHHIYIYIVRNAELIKEYRFSTNATLLNATITYSDIKTYIIFAEIEGENIYNRGKIKYRDSYANPFEIIECSSWIFRDY